MKKITLLVTSILIISALLLSACGGATPTEVLDDKPAEEEAVVEEAEEEVEEEAMAEKPTELRIAIGVVFLEEAWTTGLLQSLEKVIAEQPYGLEISYDIIEEFTFADAGRILEQVASTGEYDMIWAHSTFYEVVAPLAAEYPDIAWAVAGAGNETEGGNMWYMEITGYEGAYLIGALAGLLTESNNIGTVAEYPFPIMNSLINGYFEGARSVNPEIETQYSFIESWFDPPKAIESIAAQIANGADFIFSQPIGPIEACMDASVWCAGNYVDQRDLGPDVVLTSNLILWEPHWNAIIDGWWNYTVDGAPYDAPAGPLMFRLAEGGTDIVPIDDMGGVIPAEVIEQVMDIRQQMIDGTLVVEYNPEAPE